MLLEKKTVLQIWLNPGVKLNHHLRNWAHALHWVITLSHWPSLPHPSFITILPYSKETQENPHCSKRVGDLELTGVVWPIYQFMGGRGTLIIGT